MIHAEQDRELVGILCGKILEPGDVLCIYLYRLPSGHHATRVEQWPEAHASSIALDKAERHKVRTKFVQCTDKEPRWYYVQLNRRYPPSTLCAFSLPWSVLQGQCYEDDWRDL